MEFIYEQVEQLADTVKNSKEYLRYQECLKALKADKEVYEQFKSFQTKYFKLTDGNEDYFSKVEELQEEFRDMLSLEIVIDFMEANDSICDILKNIYIMFAEEIPLDLDFLDEN